MQTSALCNAQLPEVSRPEAGSLTEQTVGSGNLCGRDLNEVVEDFSTFLYSMVFKEMQKMVSRDESSAIADGVQGLVGRYLPKTLAQNGGSPLGRYVKDEFHSHFGAMINEHA